MTYQDTIDKCLMQVENIQGKSFFQLTLGGILAGAYVGFAIILVFTIGDALPSHIRPLVMGASFGIALTLVIIAGSDLFTGYTLFLGIGIFNSKIKLVKALKILCLIWLANLIGSFFIALLYKMCDTSLLNEESFIHIASLKKVTYNFWTLLFRGIMCNWLVCLAIWMCHRTSDTGKFIAIWWCLFAFIACGYEHSVANMTLLSLSWLGVHGDTYTLMAIFYNLGIVTIGNMISGFFFVGWVYNFLAKKRQSFCNFVEVDTKKSSRLRELEINNGKLKKLLAEAYLHIEALKEYIRNKHYQNR